MPQHEFRIFLSAVSSEFGRARNAVAADLRSRDLGRSKAEIQIALKSALEDGRQPPL